MTITPPAGYNCGEMILQDVASNLVTQGRRFDRIRGLVAELLLERAEDGSAGRRWLTQRDIAAITGASWGMVHLSLQSLQDEGAIRMERNRLVVNRESLERMAACAVR